MNRRVRDITELVLVNGGHFIIAAAGLLLVFGTGGCASSRSTSLIIHPAALMPPTMRSNEDTELKLVTYNIWGLPSWMTGARPGRYTRIARELERLDPDLILLQEAWTAKARTAAPADGRWAIARAAGQHTFFQQSGLVTLSKFPVLSGRFYPFSRAAFPDKFVNTGVLKVTVKLPGDELLNLWNVHLQDEGSPTVRRTQIRELIARVRAARDGQMADLVGGDFNCTPDSEFFQELTRELGPSVQQLGGGRQLVTWDGLSAKPGSGKTLDYIFVRESTRCKTAQAAQHAAFMARTLNQRLSDHLGIEAEVRFRANREMAGGTPVVFGEALPMAFAEPNEEPAGN